MYNVSKKAPNRIVKNLQLTEMLEKLLTFTPKKWYNNDPKRSAF